MNTTPAKTITISFRKYAGQPVEIGDVQVADTKSNREIIDAMYAKYGEDSILFSSGPEHAPRTASDDYMDAVAKTGSAAHTPGPWHVSHELTAGFSIAREIAPNCGNLLPVAVAVFTPNYNAENVAVARANANLLAAAPELLEALEGMLEWARRVTQKNPGPEVAAACAAVMKALHGKGGN